MEGLNIVDIPRGILCDILLKLPVWTIKQCGCVCKTFRDIVSDSEFKQVYSSRVCLVLLDRNHLWCIDSCALTETPTDGILKQSQSQDGLPLTDKSRFIIFQIPISIELVNSSNGLVCLRSFLRSHPHYYICNPLLGEILRVPPTPTVDCWSFAFGFDSKSKQCKILQLFYKPGTNIVVAELYQSGDNKWRVIENVPTLPAMWRSAFDPSLNGALHWLPITFGESNFISSFDLHTNEFKLLSPPSQFDFNYRSKISIISVGVLKGCLCLCYVTMDGQFETWLMKEYGVQESWVKVFTVDIYSSCYRGLRLQYTPIGFSSSGDMWVKAASYPCSLVSYSAEVDVFKQIDIGVQPHQTFQATPHVFSFLSLKDMVNLKDTHLHIKKLQPNLDSIFL